MPSLLKMMAEMGLNISPFQKGLQQAKQVAATQGNNIGQAFSATINRYFGVAALTAFGASMVKRIGEIKDLADQFNLTTDEVQKFGAAFENSGLQASDAAQAIDRLNKARREAVESSQDLRDAFAMFGVSVDQLNDASIQTKDIFRQIGVAIREGQVGDKERAAMMDLMGKNGAQFVAAMKELETVKPTIIEQEQIETIEKATKSIRRLRKEIEASFADTINRADKGDFGGALLRILGFKDVDTQMEERQRQRIEARKKLVKDALKTFKENRELPEKDFAAVKDIPEERKAIADKKLFEDGIAAKQRLATGKLQAEVEEKMSEIVFGKLNKEQQVSSLRKKQRDLEAEIAYQQKQKINDLYTEEVRQENIANLKKEQLDAEQKIQALQRQGAIGFSGFRELAQTGGFNPANFAPIPSRGRPREGAGMEKAIGVLGEIENQLKNKKVILGR